MYPKTALLLCFCILLARSSIAFDGDDAQEHQANLRGLVLDTASQEEEYSNLHGPQLDAADQEEHSIHRFLEDIEILNGCRDEDGFFAVVYCATLNALVLFGLFIFCSGAAVLGLILSAFGVIST